MRTFDELGLEPSLVEALAAEGIEEPSPLQAEAIPVIGRGSSVVLRAAPGSGLLVTYAAPILGRIPAETGHPSVIVLSSDRSRCGRLALALSRLTGTTGHVVGALGVPWHEPERSDVLFTTPTDAVAAVRTASLKLDGLKVLVLETGGSLLENDADRISSLVSSGPEDPVQVVVASDPLTRGLRDWVDVHARRAVYLPPEAARGDHGTAPTSLRGSLAFRTVERDPEDVVPEVVRAALQGGAAHVLLFSRSADDAADTGDLLAVRGFVVGRPGEPDATVWLGLDPLGARGAAVNAGIDPDDVTTISVTPPLDADGLDRRHGGGWGAGIVLVAPREVAHLRSISNEAGYELTPVFSPPPSVSERRGTLASQVESALQERDLVPYALLLEPLLREHGSTQVAAALAAVLAAAEHSAARPEEALPGPSARPPAWTRLFLSIGKKDGVGPRDLLGAIVGEAGVDAGSVGKIELKDAFSRVEVHDDIASRVISALNGTSIRGRSVRADFDRSESRSREVPAGRAVRRDRRSAGS